MSTTKRNRNHKPASTPTPVQPNSEPIDEIDDVPTIEVELTELEPLCVLLAKRAALTTLQNKLRQAMNKVDLELQLTHVKLSQAQNNLNNQIYNGPDSPNNSIPSPCRY